MRPVGNFSFWHCQANSALTYAPFGQASLSRIKSHRSVLPKDRLVFFLNVQPVVGPSFCSATGSSRSSTSSACNRMTPSPCQKGNFFPSGRSRGTLISSPSFPTIRPRRAHPAGTHLFHAKQNVFLPFFRGDERPFSFLSFRA